MSVTPIDVRQVQEAVRNAAAVVARGHRTKTALSHTRPDASELDMRRLTGVTAYEPGEFVFSAWSGTSVREVAELLAQHGQYLPFDPPLVSSEATLGGTVAAGLSGSGRLRFGGLRDFLIGIELVDGTGNLVTGGGSVVKNAAGFDLPKLMIGSLGRFGVLTRLTFKVFPRPVHHRTLVIRSDDLSQSVNLLTRLAAQPLDLNCLDLTPPGTLYLRLAGAQEALADRAQEINSLCSSSAEVMTGDAEPKFWSAQSEFTWAAACRWLAKVPLPPASLVDLDADLDRLKIQRRYTVAGNLAWLAGHDGPDLDQLDVCLQQRGLSGLLIRGQAARFLGRSPANGFDRRLKAALDPAGKFPE